MSFEILGLGFGVIVPAFRLAGHISYSRLVLVGQFATRDNIHSIHGDTVPLCRFVTRVGARYVCIYIYIHIYIYKLQTCGLEESFGTFALEARFMANMNRGVDPDHALVGSKMIMCRCCLCCMKRNRGCRCTTAQNIPKS